MKVRSPFLAYEKRIVKLVKNECALAYTEKMDIIIKDFEESRVLNKSFLKEVNAINGVQSNFRVVNSRSWTATKKLDANLIPSVVSDGLERLEQFYYKAGENKRL